jgi:poly(3-hydroxybutyrate) depolymerase
MKMQHTVLIGLALIAAAIIGVASSAANSAPKLVTYTTTPTPLQGYLCKPPGRGPFPLVVYNHGGMGYVVGGAPKETCEALARGGYVGLAPLRRQTHSMRGHINDVLVGKQYGQNLPMWIGAE